MSIGHDLTVLELESQIDVLSRIQFVSRFGSNLMHIEGVKGSGKSWLAQRYLEKWCDEADQVLLMCHSSQTTQQQRGIILKQMVRDPLFNEFDTVVDSVGRMLAGEKCNLVLVIDDAHLLSSELLSELWLLVQKAQSAPNWQINVLLFAEKGKLTLPLSQMSYGQDNKPVDVDIDALSEEEAATFAELLVVRFAESREDKNRIRNLVDKSNRLPAELIALGEKKTERRIIIRSVTHSPVGILGLASVLLLGAVGSYFWFNSSSVVSEPSVVDLALEGDTQLVVPAPETNDLVINNSDNQSVEDDSSAIPPEIIELPVIAETPLEEGQRVVVPSELVDSLIHESKLASESITDTIIEKKESLVSDSDKTIKAIAKTINVVPEVKVKPETKTVSESKDALRKKEPSKNKVLSSIQDEPPKETLQLADKELKAISEKRYILQLAALTNSKAAQEFLKEHDIESSARIYQTLRNGSIWYIVTFGDYASISSARGAVKTLPSSVQSLGPWAKSLVQVHREIDSVK